MAAWIVPLGGMHNGLAQSSIELLTAEQAIFQQAIVRANASILQIEVFGTQQGADQTLIAEGPFTGTVISSEGWIVASSFGFQRRTTSILVTLPDGSRVPAMLKGRDHAREIVLLKVDVQQPLPEIAVCPKSELRVGQWSIALGKTFDAQMVTQSVGIVSALGRAYEKAIQTDCKVSPVNYGGPLIDLQGRAIGILTAMSPGNLLEGDGTNLYDSGIGFAIPLEDILSRLETLQNGSDIHAGLLGIVSQSSNELAGPVRVAGATPGSPAARAGLRVGDIVIAADGLTIRKLADLRHALGKKDAGQLITIHVFRDGKELEFECQLAKEIPVYRDRFLGMRVSKSEGHFIVHWIEPDSPAAAAGIEIGWRCTHCNGEEIASVEQLRSLVAVAELDIPLTFRFEIPATLADDGKPIRELKVHPNLWPEELPHIQPPVDDRIEENMQVTLEDVALGNVSNKIFALIPPLADARELGLLALYPEPGEVLRDKVLSAWESFCRDRGWILVIIPSSNATHWNSEEAELAGRIITRFENRFRLDKSRTIVGGLGIGGRLGLLAASQSGQKVSGVVTIGTSLERFGLRRANSPQQTLRFLLVGENERLIPAAEQFQKAGFAANVIATDTLELQKWETIPVESIGSWLEGMGRL